MRICILANALAVHTQRWAVALAGRGHQVTVLSIRAAEIDGVRVVTERVGPANSSNAAWVLLSYLRLLLRARGVIRQLAPDVVNAHYCQTHGVIAAFAGARPRVVNVWGSDVATGQPIAYWRRSLIRYALRNADVIVATSRYLQIETERLLDRRPPIRIVPFGVDVDTFRPPTQHSPQDGVVVGFVKAFHPRYAPESFVEAAVLAVRQRPGLHFVMAGVGPSREKCRALAARAGIAGRIAFPGFVEHASVPALMGRLDILVNCSRYESFGVVICEASATGLPVVATDVGGVRETVTHGVTGLLVPPDDVQALADAVCELASDPAKRRSFGAAGRKMVCARFEWHESVASFEAVLTAAVTARPAGGK